MSKARVKCALTPTPPTEVNVCVYVCVWLQYSRSNQTPHEKSHSPIVCSHNRKHPAVWLCSDGHRRQGSQSPPCSPLAPLLFWYRSLSLQPGSRSLCSEPVIKANSGKHSTGSTGIQWLLWCCTDLLFKQQLTSHMQHFFVSARGSNLRIIVFDLEHIFIWAVITVTSSCFTYLWCTSTLSRQPLRCNQ